MIAVVDYGAGNLFSLVSSLKAVGAECIVTSDKEVLKSASGIILPGVGAFGDAAKKLKSSGLFEPLKALAAIGKPLLGICLGMQLLFEKSYEYGVHEGLGLIEGEVKPLAERAIGLKVPHMGWNALNISSDCRLFKYLSEGDYMYFVHSYYADCDEKYVAATADYGFPVTAAVSKGNVFGMQFHPEKSGEKGLSILKAFSEME